MYVTILYYLLFPIVISLTLSTLPSKRVILNIVATTSTLGTPTKVTTLLFYYTSNILGKPINKAITIAKLSPKSLLAKPSFKASL